MNPHARYSLQSANTFGFDVNAEFFAETDSVEALREWLAWRRQKACPLFLLGGGSNLVLTRDIPGLTIRQINTDITIEEENDDAVQIHASAGVAWHTLVRFSVEHSFYGIENLSLIPGTAGAAPIQNIGAYGVELADVLASVDVMSVDSGETRTIDASECGLAYRESRFKRDWKGELVITGIRLKLSKKRRFTLSYAALKDHLARVHPDDLSIADVSDAVCAIRSSKLPDPTLLGNAGSFFKNPEISVGQLREIRERFPDIPAHETASGQHKIPAAWLVDHAGWKGRHLGNIGVHDRQAIVLVNHGGGTGGEVMELAEAIREDIASRYNIRLDVEPVVI